MHPGYLQLPVLVPLHLATKNILASEPIHLARYWCMIGTRVLAGTRRQARCFALRFCIANNRNMLSDTLMLGVVGKNVHRSPLLRSEVILLHTMQAAVFPAGCGVWRNQLLLALGKECRGCISEGWKRQNQCFCGVRCFGGSVDAALEFASSVKKLYMAGDLLCFP